MYLEPAMREMIRNFSVVMICLFLSSAILATNSQDVFRYTLEAGGIMMLWSTIEAMALPDDFWE